jgi:hypothetical protein
VEGKSPYREPRPLNAIIAPDRRRLHALLLVIASMVVGAVVLELGRWALEQNEKTATETPAPLVMNEGRLVPVMLTGPDGTMRVPAATGKTIVNVWLQGCQDCMPAFEAMREKGITSTCDDAKVINVSFGDADPTWAGRYNVRTNLVYDRGGNSVVRPLGISSFTTLVVDENGQILHRDRPDRVGFQERMSAFCEHHPQRLDTANPYDRGPFDQAAVERVVASHRATIKRACWDSHDEKATQASVTVHVVVAPTGAVVEAAASGTDKVVANCVESQVRAWTFPAPGERKVLSIPFKFVRQ